MAPKKLSLNQTGLNGQPDWINRLFDTADGTAGDGTDSVSLDNYDTLTNPDTGGSDGTGESDAEQYISDALQSLFSLTDPSTQDQGGPVGLPIDNSGYDTSSGSGSDTSMGLGTSDQDAFDQIIQAESHGDVNAKNPSGAFGRGQIMPFNRPKYAKKAGVSNPNTTNAAEQDRMALLYMNDRYGSPAKALDFRKRHGWY